MQGSPVMLAPPARPRFEPNGDLRGRPAGFLSIILPGIVIAANLLALAYNMGWLATLLPK